MSRFAALLLILLALPAHAATLKISTWNLDWLTLRHTGDPALPADVHTRSQSDFTALAGYAQKLDADVIAFQEVDGPQAAAKLFPPDRYNLVLTHDDVIQRVGFAIRRGIEFHQNPDVTDLVPYKHAKYLLRSGADVTLTVEGHALRLLAVHLKTGCWEVPLSTSKYACRTLERQIPPLRAWIEARDAEGTPFVVLGDFNRVMDGADHFHEEIDPDANQPRMALVRPDAGFASPCWGGDHFIDHIFLGGPARAWLVPHSLDVLVYRQTARVWKDRLSDHCPVSVQLRIP